MQKYNQVQQQKLGNKTNNIATMSYDPANLETLFEPRELDAFVSVELPWDHPPLPVDRDPMEPSRCPYAPPYEELVSPLEPALPNMDPREDQPPLPIDRDPVSPLDPAFQHFLSVVLPEGHPPLPVDRDPLEPSRCPYAPPHEEMVFPLEALQNIDPQDGHPSLSVDRDPVSPLDPAFRPFLSADLPLGPAYDDPSATDGCVIDQEELAREEDPDRLQESGKNRHRLQRLREWVRKRVSTKPQSDPTSGTL